MGEPVPRLDDVEPHFQALIALHSLSPDFREEREKLPESYRERSVPADLRLVAEADEDQIPTSARLAVLYDLAKANYPGREQNEDARDAYRELADSAVRFRMLREEDAEVAGDDLLAEIKAAADEGAPLSTRPRLLGGPNFRHNEVAFIGRDVCTTRSVRVGGTRAVWIYSEFETDASFQHLSTWLDPQGWHQLSPMFFKHMALIGPLDALPAVAPPPGNPHWEGVFHEEVQLFEPVNTLLRCNYWRDQNTTTTAVTYDLELSVDKKLDVDRGFLLVTPTGDRRRVQVLKIVSFTQNLWDLVALLVCPFWTTWIRAAVKDAQNVTVVDPPTMAPDASGSPVGQLIEDWVEYFGDAVQPYLDLCTGVTSRLQASSYTPAAAVADGARWWSQFAQDWARAWTNWSETVEQVAKHGLDAGLTPPGSPVEHGRGAVSTLTAIAEETVGTVVTVGPLLAGEKPMCSELVSIGRRSATIPANEVVLVVETVAAGAQRVRVRTTSASAPPGMYVGRLRTAANENLAPVRLYVSRATKA